MPIIQFAGQTLTGTAGSDVLLGSDYFGANSVLMGGAGNDLIFGDIHDAYRGLAPSTFETAYDMSATSLWTRSENVDISNATTIPHASAYLQGGGTPAYFSFTLTAGQTLTVDVDFGDSTVLDGAFDSTLALFASDGTPVASNDDDPSNLAGTMDLGSVNIDTGRSYDSLLTFTAATAGTYVLQVGQVFGPVPVGGFAVVNFSLTGQVVESQISGNDRLYGGDGEDYLHGGAGADTLYGGADFDRLYGDSGADLIFGGTGIDVLVGGEGNDRLIGEAGDDAMLGEAGDDLLRGGAGADLIYGGTGNDDIRGGDDRDAIAGDAGNDRVYGGAAADLIFGGAGDDWLSGDAQDDLITGDAGQDQIIGGDGFDTLAGGDGHDRLRGGAQADVLAGENGNDYLQGDAAPDTLFGGAGRDILFGGTSADLLQGEAGNDYLRGDLGADVLFGGGGSDMFMFRTFEDSKTNASQRDRIVDFTRGEDRIDVAGMDADRTRPGNQAFDFKGYSVFDGVDRIGDVHIRQVPGGVMAEVDVDGDGDADMAIYVQGVGTLGASDFIL